MNMKITVIGMGYVGLSNAILLAQNNEVVILDVLKEKVNMINEKKLPIIDNEIIEYLQKAIEADPQSDAAEQINQAIKKLEKDIQ